MLHLQPALGPCTGACSWHAAQVWLQDFAWTEADTPARLERRASNAVGPAERQLLAEAPLFCFETGLKLLRWSQLAYLGALPDSSSVIVV